MKTIYLLVVIIILVIFPETESGVYSQGSRPSQTDDQNAKYYKTNQKVAESASRDESHPIPGRKWISAWGIIALIIGIIIFSTITYYVFLLFPNMCKKDASYDIIELTEVNSVCTVSDNVNNMPHMRVYCGSNNVSNDILNESDEKA